MDEPTSLDFDPSGNGLLVDSGSGHAYRFGADTATAVGGGEEISAAAILADGGVIVASKNGLSVGGAKPVFYTATWGGKARQVKKVRAMAGALDGNVYVVSKDYDGVLKCQPSTATCVIWGPPTKQRVVKVGPTGLVYLVDDRQQSLRVFDPSGRQLAGIGPMMGATKFGEIVDIDVDAASGLVVLDKDTRRVYLLALRGASGGLLSAEMLGSVAIPSDGDRALKNPSAVGITPDGAIVVAGRSAPRFLRFQ
jgi:hypothetical protein